MKDNNQFKITDELLAGYFADELSAIDRNRIEDWKKQSHDNHLYLEQSRIVWMDLGILRGIDSKEKTFDVEAAWKKVNLANQNNAKKSYQYGSLLRIAASIIIISGIGFLVYTNFYQNTNQQLISSNEILINELSEGSIVTLNQQSTLTYPKKFKQDKREVTLTGEAFFEVVPDPEKPFIINTSGAKVKVLGTSFNISSYDDKDSTVVFVSTGKVLLFTTESEITLTPGMTGIYVKSTGLLTSIKNETTGIYDFWRTKTLNFKGLQLSEIVSVLNKIYQVNIVIKNNEIRDCQINVSFENESIESILEIISSTLNLDVIQSENQILLDGKGC